MKKRLLIYLLLFMAITASATLWLFTTSGEYHRKYSPDKQYSVYAAKYRYDNFIPKMPGSSGDASGKVYLYDEINKKILNSVKVPMISIVDEMEWDVATAYFKGDRYPNIINPWHLPRPIKMSYTKVEESDTVKTIKEFSPFGKVQSITIKEQIYGGWKSVHYESYDELGNKTLEWQKQYSNNKENTYDFTPYIIHYRYYQNKKLVSENYEHSACDDCETYPCGTETQWDSFGKVISKKVHEGCDIDFKPRAGGTTKK